MSVPTPRLRRLQVRSVIPTREGRPRLVIGPSAFHYRIVEKLVGRGMWVVYGGPAEPPAGRLVLI